MGKKRNNLPNPEIITLENNLIRLKNLVNEAIYLSEHPMAPHYHNYRGPMGYSRFSTSTTYPNKAILKKVMKRIKRLIEVIKKQTAQIIKREVDKAHREYLLTNFGIVL